jgi:hypothetical protein
MTVYQSHFRTSLHESREKRIYTSNPGNRNLRKKDTTGDFKRQTTTQHDASFLNAANIPARKTNNYTVVERKNNKGKL